MNARSFNVCIKTQYRRHADGEVKDKFTNVGSAYESIMKDTGKSVINLLIGPNILITEKTPLILFERDRENTE